MSKVCVSANKTESLLPSYFIPPLCSLQIDRYFCEQREENSWRSLFTSTSFFLLYFFQTIKDVDLQALGSLEYINLSRNLIREIMPGTFLGPKDSWHGKIIPGSFAYRALLPHSCSQARL